MFMVVREDVISIIPTLIFNGQLELIGVIHILLAIMIRLLMDVCNLLVIAL